MKRFAVVTLRDEVSANGDKVQTECAETITAESEEVVEQLALPGVRIRSIRLFEGAVAMARRIAQHHLGAVDPMGSL